MPLCDETPLVGVATAPVCVAEPHLPCDAAWEAAYLRFETAEEEICKFQKRLKYLGADDWSMEWNIAELFCGRGNGLVALERLGFKALQGADVSEALISQYRGAATCHVADCRDVPFGERSLHVAIVQGGLHHLPKLPDDLERVFKEVSRVLVPGGKFVVVEPWRTPFLDCVHCACNSPLVVRISQRFEALATMIEHERETYEQWLAVPEQILQLLHHYFEPVQFETRWGKLLFRGSRK